MSGWNKKTGLYELTFSQAKYWLRRKDFAPECKKLEDKDFLGMVSCILEKYGMKVVNKHKAWLDVKCNSAGEIWEALSGQPANPESIAHHDHGKPQ